MLRWERALSGWVALESGQKSLHQALVSWLHDCGRLPLILYLRNKKTFSDNVQRGCYCQVTSVVSDSVRPHRRQPTRFPQPWDSPGKNTGVGCHFLLQCMKVKSESAVSRVRLLVTPWTAAHQAPLSMRFSRQEYWSGVPTVQQK